MTGRTLAIMQPYFLPYIGYWQLLKAVDEFVVYDNIQYTKKGWINRNRFLSNGADALFTLPLKAASDYSDIAVREIVSDSAKQKLVRQLEQAYRKAPFFDMHFPLLQQIISCPDTGLFSYIHRSIVTLCAYFDIQTKITVSSDVAIDHNILKGQDKVIGICRALGAATYINAIGGMELYHPDVFKDYGIDLKFIKAKPLAYMQFKNDFIPHLSIVDVMMFNDRQTIRGYLDQYELISNAGNTHVQVG